MSKLTEDDYWSSPDMPAWPGHEACTDTDGCIYGGREATYCQHTRTEES